MINHKLGFTSILESRSVAYPDWFSLSNRRNELSTQNHYKQKDLLSLSQHYHYIL